jgi:phosphohistidine phosphatase
VPQPAAACDDRAMRELVIVRHAEAGHAPGRPDHDRPLTEAGRLAAGGIAARIGAAGCAPELVVASTAQRAEETARVLARDLGDLPLWCERDLYLADGEVLLARLRELPEGCAGVALVGHNPGLQHLAWLLADEAGRPRVGTRFPPGALAALRFAAPAWTEVTEAGGELVALSSP